MVASAGNRGSAPGRLTNPAIDPYLLAVGADDSQGTVGTDDDVVPSWSSSGDGVRNPDVVAPGAHVQSLLAPESSVAAHGLQGRISARYQRGSGTSQAAAVASGAAALLLGQRPQLTPDQVKGLLLGTARRLPAADAMGQGRGLVNLRGIGGVKPSDAPQTWPASTGTGSLEQARGTAHVTEGSVS